ncbi:hypothetical protein MCOR25_004934 [Pyricularia grisea]|nr:hypothetical protein MCOR25_004934 [Pyricularia grisea]
MQDGEDDVEIHEPGIPASTDSQRYDLMDMYQQPHYRQTQAHSEGRLAPASSRNHQNPGREQLPSSGPRNQANMRTFATPTRPFHAWNSHHDTFPDGSPPPPTPFSPENREQDSRPAAELYSTQPRQNRQYEQQGQQGQRRRRQRYHPQYLPRHEQQDDQSQHQQRHLNSRDDNHQQSYQEQQQGGPPSIESPATFPVTTGETPAVTTTNTTGPQRRQERAKLKPRVGRRAIQTKKRAERSAQESARRAAIVEKMIKDGVLRHA